MKRLLMTFAIACALAVVGSSPGRAHHAAMTRANTFAISYMVLTLALFFTFGRFASASSVHAQDGITATPDAAATPTIDATPGLGEASPTVPPPPSPPVAPAVPTPLAERLISTDGSLDGELRQPSGQSVRTLVELHLGARVVDGRVVIGAPPNRLFSLITDERSQFSFTNIPPGEYVLWVWWGPGFIELPTSVPNPGLFIANVDVGSDGSVTGGVPEAFDVRERPEGVIGYPVRGGGDTTLFNGAVNVAQQLQLETIKLPTTGVGFGDDTMMLVALTAALLAAGAVFIGVAAKRRGRAA